MRTCLYLRQSRDYLADGLAVDRQRKACLSVVEQRGWAVARVFEEKPLSASKRNVRRPQYEAMLEAVGAGEIDAICCYDLDRLTRQPSQLEHLVDMAEQRGLVVVTATGDFDLSTDNGRLWARLKASIARAEVERKGARQTLANKQRVDGGRQVVGTRALGWTQDGRIDPVEAAQVKAFFQGFADKQSLFELAATAAVPPRRAKAWSTTAVRRVLQNQRYAGRLTYHGEVVAQESDLPAIVDADLFDRVQAMLADPGRRKSAVGTHRRYLGSGIYRCENGHRMRTTTGRYKCGEACYGRSRGPVDELVLELVARRLDMPDVERPGSEVDPALVSEVRRLRDRLAVTESDYDQGLIDGRRFKAASDRINAELSQAEARLAGSSDRAALVGVTSGEVFLGLSLMRQRAVVAALLEVTLLPVPQGVKGFDPSTVRVEWRD